MNQLNITAVKRTEIGKGNARKMRRDGKVPAIVYGKKADPLSVVVEERALASLLRQSSKSIITLKVEDDDALERSVLVKDLQKDPIKDNILHIDFLQIALDEVITTEAYVVFIGQDDREDDGGVLQQLIRTIEIECLPMNIPERIEVDVSGLKIGDSLKVEDIDAGEGITFITPGDEVLASVVVPAMEEEEEEEEETDEAEEPEVIGEGEEEEETAEE